MHSYTKLLVYSEHLQSNAVEERTNNKCLTNRVIITIKLLWVSQADQFHPWSFLCSTCTTYIARKCAQQARLWDASHTRGCQNTKAASADALGRIQSAVIPLSGTFCQFKAVAPSEVAGAVGAQERLRWHPTHQTCPPGISFASPRARSFFFPRGEETH